METIGDNVFVETVYPGVNIGCLVTPGGSLCVDTPLLPGEAQRWRARIKSLGGEPVRFVVYTSGHQERILGTQYLVDLPAPQARLSRPRRPLSPLVRPTPLLRPVQPPFVPDMNAPPRAAVLAHEAAWELIQEHRTDGFKQSIVDMVGERDPDIKKLRVVPPHITCTTSAQLYIGDYEVTLIGAASGVLWVWLPEVGVLFTGDTLVVGTHPPLMLTPIDEWLAALDRLRHTPDWQEAVIVPGRGPLCDLSAVDPLVAYLTMARDGTWKVFTEGRPKADLNDLASELVTRYPVPDGHWERVQRQIRAGLDALYESFKLAEVPTR